jgi:hypothetical protein
MQIDFSDTQYENVQSSIRISLQHGSKVRFTRELQPGKQDKSMIRPADGIQIDWNNRHLKPDWDSIRMRREIDSNARV